jgi:predicted ribosome quality control (RQC) complex YloA/Tae2 family protein
VHNNYYFLRQLSFELTSILAKGVVSECFSQNKEELIIRFETTSTPFFIKASLQSEFCCLSFPEEFTRARKNSVDLFEPLIGQRVKGIAQYDNERSFSIEFSNQFSLLFKMHGNRANLVLFEKEEAVAIFRNHLTADFDLKLNSLHRAIDWTYDTFIKNHQNLQSLYFTFGKPIWNFLNQSGFQEKPVIEQWQDVQDLLKYLEKPHYFIVDDENKLSLSLFGKGIIVREFNSPIPAITEFFHHYTKTFSIASEKNEILTTLKIKLANSTAYVKKALQKKSEIENDNHYKTWADLIMANLHQIKTGIETITLSDFYQENKPIEIKLKKDLSAQKNAEIFYRKSKNQLIEISKVNESIQSKQKEIEILKEKINTVEAIGDLKTLRGLTASLGLKQEAERKEKPLPYHEVEYHGFKIWIGKNAQHNDTLTLKYTFKDDLWLHAKDVPGSHVVIKYQSGKVFPKDVIERAAQLAAFNSKRKTDTLCPVAYTPKKFVRKRKGDPAGAVIVDREDVILVEPKGF